MLLIYSYKKDRLAPWGVRYIIEVKKECNNIPGFAPETYISNVGEIVQKFKDPEKEPYFMPEMRGGLILTAEELRELAKMTNSRFVKKNYS